MLSWITWVLKCLQTSLTLESRSYSEHGGKPSVLSTAEFNPSLKRSTDNGFCKQPHPSWCCSVTQLCPAPWDPVDCSPPGFSVLHCLQSLLKVTATESVMPSDHLIPCCPLSLCLRSSLASGAFPMSWFFASGVLVHQHKRTKTRINS